MIIPTMKTAPRLSPMDRAIVDDTLGSRKWTETQHVESINVGRK